MNFKNYIKISISNYASAWKFLLYRIIVWGVVFALMAPFYSLIRSLVLDAWNLELFKELALAGLFYGSTLTVTFAKVTQVVITLLTSLFTQHLAAGIYLAVVLFLVRPFLMNIGRYVVSETTYGYMSSQSKHGFCSTMVRTLKKSTSYAILRALFALPFIFLTGGVFYLLLQANWGANLILMPFAFLASATFILTWKQLLLMGWAPAMVVSGENVAKSYNLGLKATMRCFGKSLLFSVLIVFVGILLVLGFGVISVAVIMPVCAICSAMYETMHFFACHGMRYYTDKDHVLSSKKLEEQDTISQIKFLI